MVSCHAPPSKELHLVNLPQFGDREAVLEKVKQFGDVVKFSYGSYSFTVMHGLGG